MMKYVFLLFYLWVLLPLLGHGQTSCRCDTQDLLLNERDSVEVFHFIDKLKQTKNEMCAFKALSAEIAYYAIKQEKEKMEGLLQIQLHILESSSCKEILSFDYYFSNVLYYRALNNYEKLSEFGFKALREAEKLNDSHKQIEAIKQIVFLFTRVKEGEKNWAYIKRVEKLINKVDSPIQQARHYRWLAFEYENKYTGTQRITLIDSALQFASISKKVALQYKMYDELALSYRVYEAFSYHTGKLNDALRYIDSAIYFGKKIKGEKNLGPFFMAKAWDHLDLKQYSEAEKWMDTALALDNSSDKAGYMMLQFEASNIYEGAGNLKKALSSFRKYSKMKDSILDTDRVKIINDLEAKYQTELKDAQITNLNQQRKIDVLELENKQAQINKLITVIIVISLIAIFIFSLFKVAELKKAKAINKALQDAIANSEKLEREITNVRENIAQDFHDDLGNKLARISLFSNLMMKDESAENKLKQKLTQITEDANYLYAGTRDFIFSLKKNSDYPEELVTYLSDFGEECYKSTAIKFRVNKQLDSNARLPYYWSKQLIFIFKEAMTNALKHSGATEVTLHFLLQKNLLVVKCIDNGKGFEVNKIILNGIAHMKQRAKKISGELKVTSIKNEGTIIMFKGKTA